MVMLLYVFQDQDRDFLSRFGLTPSKLPFILSIVYPPPFLRLKAPFVVCITNHQITLNSNPSDAFATRG